jgi:hypothetical protein
MFDQILLVITFSGIKGVKGDHFGDYFGFQLARGVDDLNDV